MTDIGPGDRVEYLGGPWDPSAGEVAPEVGSIYIVRDLVDLSHAASVVSAGRQCIRLVEIKNPSVIYHGCVLPIECGFPIDRFRPVRDTHTDIEQFRQIDRDVFEGQPVDA